MDYRLAIIPGWVGLIVIIVLCVNSCFGGSRLTLCWEIIKERYPQYSDTTRNPYPAIAEKAVGRWGRHLVSLGIQIILFGAGVLYVLLGSQIFQELLKPFIPNITYYTWVLIFALIVKPLTWLGSPKDFFFRLIRVGIVLTMLIGCVLLFFKFSGTDTVELDLENEYVEHIPNGFMDFFISFGIILFGFGGALIQNDMDVIRKLFSVLVGVLAILFIYMPLYCGGNFIYGESTQPNILLPLKETSFVSVSDIYMSAHVFIALLIVINLGTKEIEYIFDVPHEFSLLPCDVPAYISLLMIVIGETIPEFSKIIAHVGGSTITLLFFVLPSLFYMKLCSQKSIEWPERTIPLFERLYMWEIMFLAVLGGIGSSSLAIHGMIYNDSVSRPSYWFQLIS